MSPCVRSAPSRPTRRRRKSCEDSGNRSPCFRNLLKSFSCAICRNTSLRPESDAGVGETVPWETVLAEALARLPHGDHLDRLIESDPAVMLGKPVIRGTRITVELILRKRWSRSSSRTRGLHLNKSKPRSRMPLKVWPARSLWPKTGIEKWGQTFAKDDSMASPKNRSRI